MCLFCTVVSFWHAQVCNSGSPWVASSVATPVLWGMPSWGGQQPAEVPGTEIGRCVAENNVRGDSQEVFKVPKNTQKYLGGGQTSSSHVQWMLCLYLSLKRDTFEGLKNVSRGYSVSRVKRWNICPGFPSSREHGLVGSVETGTLNMDKCNTWILTF